MLWLIIGNIPRLPNTAAFRTGEKTELDVVKLLWHWNKCCIIVDVGCCIIVDVGCCNIVDVGCCNIVDELDVVTLLMLDVVSLLMLYCYNTLFPGL